MARLRSPEKRTAILLAAVHEIAQAGLGAPTARIAGRAGVAEGTLFTYFSNKEQLLNELYIELKLEVYERINAGFPTSADMKLRTRHIWTSFLEWAIEFPEKRRTSVQLNLSDLITPETREKITVARSSIDETFTRLRNRAALRELPAGFAAATMSAMQEATMDFIAKQPEQREELMQLAFEVFWRSVR
jgi:AcrR family transcriptional regulator